MKPTDIVKKRTILAAVNNDAMADNCLQGYPWKTCQPGLETQIGL